MHGETMKVWYDITFLSTAPSYLELLFNNQPDALFIQIYPVIKLYTFRANFANHQESPTVHSALLSFMQVMMTVSKQSQDGTE
jgi:hypothetical protein